MFFLNTRISSSYSTIVLIQLVFSFIVTLSNTGLANPCLGKRNGKYSVDNECTRYSVCFAQKETRMTCPKGSIFNERSSRCEKFINYPCNASSTARRLAETKCRSEGDILPDPVSCERFLICSEDKYYSMKCPTGQMFNNKIYKCEVPNLCRPNAQQRNGPQKSPSPYKNVCVGHNNKNVSDPTYCNMYILCLSHPTDPTTNMTSIRIRACQSGLLYSEITSFCEKPGVVFCGRRYRNHAVHGRDPSADVVANHWNTVKMKIYAGEKVSEDFKNHSKPTVNAEKNKTSSIVKPGTEAPIADESLGRSFGRNFEAAPGEILQTETIRIKGRNRTRLTYHDYGGAKSNLQVKVKVPDIKKVKISASQSAMGSGENPHGHTTIQDFSEENGGKKEIEAESPEADCVEDELTTTEEEEYESTTVATLAPNDIEVTRSGAGEEESDEDELSSTSQSIAAVRPIKKLRKCVKSTTPKSVKTPKPTARPRKWSHIIDPGTDANSEDNDSEVDFNFTSAERERPPY